VVEVSAGSIFLTCSDFEIIFQVTHQASNFSDSRLAEAGCTPVDLELLIVALGSMRKNAERSSGVYIGFCDEVVPNRAAGGASDAALRVCLPVRFRAQWRSAAKLVASAVSPVELYYRTGYQFDDILAALARLSEVGD
jgi:hypothetical protein